MARSENLHVVRVLKGHSNCLVRLMRKTGATMPFVRKSAIDTGQNDRLARQCARQRQARSLGVAVPEVISDGHEAGLYYFDMTYLHGITLSHACISGQETTADTLRTFLIDLLHKLAGERGSDIPEGMFRQKLQSVLADSGTNPATAERMPAVRELVARLDATSWHGVPASASHGDLTLENIMVLRDGTFAAIDFDVPEISSFWLDLAKLRQDTHGHWCMRSLAGGTRDARYLNALHRLEPVRRTTEAVIGALAPESAPLMPQLTAFHLLRTLPYCRDRATADFVVARARAVLEE